MKCLDQIFALCGTAEFIHSDRGPSFISRELKFYLTERGIATCKSSIYHPIGNGQVERYNGIIWKGVCLALKGHGLPDSQWELVLPDVLHSIRSLLSTATNTTPHERFFSFERRSSQYQDKIPLDKMPQTKSPWTKSPLGQNPPGTKSP